MSHDFWLGYLGGFVATTISTTWGLYRMGFFDD